MRFERLRRKKIRDFLPRSRTLPGKRLTLPLALEDGRVPRTLENMVYAVTTFLILAIFWASVAEIREMAMANGQIAPSSAVKSIQHLEGGVIDAVLVNEGQLVEKGTPLIRLRPVAAESELAQLEIRAATLTLQARRLDALLAGKQPDFSDLAERHPERVQDQLELFLSQAALQKRERKTLTLRVSQTQATLSAMREELASLERQLALKRSHVRAVSALAKKGYATRRALLDAKGDYEQTLARTLSLKGRLAATEQELAEARDKLKEWEAKTREALARERAKVTAELAEVKQMLAKRSDRVARLVLRAPERGIVQFPVIRTPGEVAKPGEVLAKVVPLEENLVAEVRLKPRDVGHVEVGDPAKVKISSYDPNVFGVVQGWVHMISPTSFHTEQGETYFKAVIALERNRVGRGKRSRPILPGMEVQAEIVTGAKSLVQYMLKPVYRSLDVAFSER